MPSPKDAIFQNLSKLQFTTHGIKLPYKFPKWDMHYLQAFGKHEMSVALQKLGPAEGAFHSFSTNAYHAATQKIIGGHFFKFIDDIGKSVCSAWNTWQKAATLTGVTISGPTAAGGTVVGPHLESFIMGLAPKLTPMHLAYSGAISKAIATNWQSYIATIKVPGLAMFPSFAAFPGPVAVPTPNVPMSLSALAHAPLPVSKKALTTAMIGHLGELKALANHWDVRKWIVTGKSLMDRGRHLADEGRNMVDQAKSNVMAQGRNAVMQNEHVQDARRWADKALSRIENGHHLDVAHFVRLGDLKGAHHFELFDGVSNAFERCHKLWQSSSMVTKLIGTGPVPSFAPPAVPAGPVVGGIANMIPGGFF